MVAGIRGTCRMSIILAFKIGFLGCTLSWSCTGSQCWSCTGLGNRQCWSCTGSLETIFSFMEMRSVIWGGGGRGFGRTDLTTPPPGSGRIPARPWAPGPGRPPLAMSHEPCASSHEPSSMHQASSIKHQASSIKHQALTFND